MLDASLKRITVEPPLKVCKQKDEVNLSYHILGLVKHQTQSSIMSIDPPKNAIIPPDLPPPFKCHRYLFLIEGNFAQIRDAFEPLGAISNGKPIDQDSNHDRAIFKITTPGVGYALKKRWDLEAPGSLKSFTNHFKRGRDSKFYNFGPTWLPTSIHHIQTMNLDL